MERIGALMPIGPGDQDAHRGARRRSRRYPLNAEVELVDPISATGVTLNASAGGLRILIDREPPRGCGCVLEVRFTSERSSFERARVVWAREISDGWVVGLEFEDINWHIPADPTVDQAA